MTTTSQTLGATEWPGGLAVPKVVEVEIEIEAEGSDKTCQQNEKSRLTML